MRRRTTLLTTVALLLVAVPSAAQAQEPRIAAGVAAAGIDVSGLTLPEAANRIAFIHQQKITSPLSVHVAGRAFILRGKDVNFKFDAAKTARRAYNAGVAPHMGPVNVPLYVTFKQSKVTAYVDKIEQTVARAPRDARVDIKLSKIGKVASRDGRTIDKGALVKLVAATLGDPALDRKPRPALVPVKPKITTAGLSRAYGTIVTIDRANFKLRLFKNLKLSKTYRVAVGMPAYPTPRGRYSISNKAVNPAWTAPNSPWAGAYANETVPGGSAENPLKARWLGIVNGVGIHGTGIPGSIGSRASHGCIRMTVPDVIDLYPRVPVGTPVLIGN
jgi:lipoprotein-anchoring transpeptidase ErfK/SrfK